MEGFSLIDLAKQTWMQNIIHITAFIVLLLAITLVMIFKDALSRRGRLLSIVRYCILIVTFLYAGILLKAQPTSTNIVIMVNALIREGQFPIGLYLMEPYIFLSFIFIFITMLTWGRGVFCGWLCPYGALLELLYKIKEKLFPHLNIMVSEKIHWKLVYLKYVFFIAILGISFYNFVLAEYLTEIEPFRTFVLKLKREWYFIAYFGLLTVGSVIVYRAFCSYICPLGGSLAILSFLKFIPFFKLHRYDFCSTCKICARDCNPQAIMANGIINSRECLDCLDCQMNFWNEDRCPVLIKQKRQQEKAK